MCVKCDSNVLLGASLLCCRQRRDGSWVLEKMTADIAKSTVHWDAGEMGCGELLIELKFRLQELNPGSVMELITLDPGAKQDMPAWCRLTGHKLLFADHPKYKIENRQRRNQ